MGENRQCPHEETLPDPQQSRHSITSLSSVAKTELVRGVPLDLCLQNWGVHFRAPHVGKEVDNFGLSILEEPAGWSLNSILINGSAMYISMFLVMAAPIYFGIQHMRDLLKLEQQMTGFSIKASECTCCVLNHRNPVTGEPLLCDRELVFQTLKRWYGTDTGSDDHLDRFDGVPSRLTSVTSLASVAKKDMDEHLKQEGIFNLAGILAKSRKLVILWSPRYFTRLWCAFELSTFLKDENRVKHIEFMPASMALLLWSASVVNMIGFSLWQWVTHRNHVGSLYRPAGWSLNGILINWLALTVSMFFVMTVPIYFGIQHMRNLLKLEEQMTSFSIKASECTCCALNHCNPATGERLLCDREVVFRTLKRWYEETGEGDHLDHFDSIVQKQLSSSVLQVVGSGAPSRRYVLAMVGTPSLAVWPQYVYLRHSDT
eukprot:g27021.t1